MRPSVALVAAGARGNSAVGSRIGAFARELGRRGWEETVLVIAVFPPEDTARICERPPTA